MLRLPILHIRSSSLELEIDKRCDRRAAHHDQRAEQYENDKNRDQPPLLVGPQEDDEFVEQVRFDLLGVFTYSDAEDLPSHRLPGHIPKKVAQFRYDTLMARQMEISATNLSSMIGATLPVLIEASPEPYLYEGRSMLQAPEVDGMTVVKTNPGGPAATIGEIASVRITDTLAYDLIGSVL